MTLRIILAAAAAAFLCSGVAEAAIFIKFEGVKGESKAARGEWVEIESVQWGRGAGARQNGVLTVKEGSDPVAVGLLLPAVQKVRDAAARSSSAPSASKGTGIGAGKVASSARQKAGAMRLREANGKEWTLHDVELVRSRAAGRADASHQIRFSYACKEWTDASGSGGDCTAAKKKKGNVEYGWKVEEGST